MSSHIIPSQTFCWKAERFSRVMKIVVQLAIRNYDDGDIESFANWNWSQHYLMTPTIRVTSIIISCRALVTNSHRPSRNFSQKSWPGHFSRSGVTGAWHRVLHVTAWRERDGARSPAPKSRARVSRNARSSGWFGHGHWGRVSGPTQRWDDHWGERETGETARTIRRQDSRDPCLGGAGAQSDTKIETRS